jgi:ElaB/YqjD/DUF883 family membrane-anchored ribosome-binding protein
MQKLVLVMLLAGTALVTGCNSMVYQAYEAVGVPKRELLKKYVASARDEQKEASKQFEDALTKLKRLYAFDGGDLENAYNSVKDDHESLRSQAATVKKRVSDVADVAEALFSEWEKELGQYSTAELRERSRTQLNQTRARYKEMHAALRKAEEAMTPVLDKLQDQVLFLKHNLNAQAVASLRGESASIQKEISRLIQEMGRAIAKADEFIKTMP